MTGIAKKLVSPSQIVFILDRNIMEGVVILHETLHVIHRKKISGAIFKIDIQKAYDKVN
jgi:hypothetical protein